MDTKQIEQVAGEQLATGVISMVLSRRLKVAAT